jgi:hypothetical protein
VSTTCDHTGCTRTMSLLIVAGGRRYCPRHLPDDDRALVADLDRRARGIGLRTTGDDWPYIDWPYGPNISLPVRLALIEWAEPLGLRYSPHGRCLHWISRGRCAVQVCRAGLESRRWMDHLTGWTRNRGAAVLVAHPYGVDGDALHDLRRVADDLNLDVWVGRHPVAEATPTGSPAAPQHTGWYGYGTTFIEIWGRGDV